MFWILIILIVAISMAMLQVAQSPEFAALFLTKLPFVEGLSVLSWVVLGLLSLLIWLVAHQVKNPWGRRLGVGVLAMGLLVGSAWQAWLLIYQSEQGRLKQPILVKAKVSVYELGDGVYDPTQNSPYRQVAVLSEIEPLSDASFLQARSANRSPANPSGKSSTADNPFGTVWEADNQDRQAHLDAKAGTKLADQMTVLLTAFPRSGQNTQNAQNTQHSQNAQNSKKSRKNQVDPLAGLQTLSPNQAVQMVLRLSPVEPKSVSASGFDEYQWLKSRHVGALASVLAVQGDPVAIWSWQGWVNAWRWRLREHFLQTWFESGRLDQENRQAYAVTLSLLTGDRALLDGELKQLYQFAGISHLLAISGSHVLFLAVLVAGLVLFGLDRFGTWAYLWLPRHEWRWWVMVLAGFLYAVFAGFDVPALRTVALLFLVGVLRALLLPSMTFRALGAVGILMVWADPFVLWQAGFWLSFVAVGVLLSYDQGWFARQKIDADFELGRSRFGQMVWDLVFLQFWLFVALLPLSLLLFGKVSLWGLVVNLFAIGFFGWFVVPLNLMAGVLYLFIPSLADGLWTLAASGLHLLHGVLQKLNAWQGSQGAWLYLPISMAMMVAASVAILPWILPKAWLSRWLSLPALVLFALLANQERGGDQPFYLESLKMDDPNTQVWLLKHQDQHWLFLADFKDTQKSNKNKNLQNKSNPTKSQKLAQQWQQQLGKHGITSLTGIIVQTPTDWLNDSVANLARALPIGQVWQAKISQPMQQRGGISLTPQKCQANKTWQNPQNSLNIQAITGWQTLDDPNLWHCSILIQSQNTLPIQNPDPILNQNAEQDPNTTPDLNTAQSLIINATSHADTWQIWQLLCPTPEQKNRLDPQNTLWINHPKAHLAPAFTKKLSQNPQDLE